MQQSYFLNFVFRASGFHVGRGGGSHAIYEGAKVRVIHAPLLCLFVRGEVDGQRYVHILSLSLLICLFVRGSHEAK